MNILEYLRNKLFWIFDAFKGKEVKKHLIDIKFINENFSSAKAKEKKDLYLRNLLNNSIKHTVFYNKMDLDSSLSSFPVINKNIIRENFSDFLSKKNRSYYEISTSGSTGTPFVIYLNKNKKKRNTADTIYFAKKTGFEIGNKLLYIRFWGDNYSKSKFSFWKQNIMEHNVFNLTDDDIKKLIFKLENDKSNIGVVAYASAFESICNYLDKINSRPIKTNIKSIILISESLNEYTKIKTKKYFGITPLSRYSNSENGIIAQQIEGSNDFIINWASYIIEILNIDNDLPVKYGELGRIVITDLFNYSVPMIRYDTGDLGVMNQNVESPVLSKVECRKLDMIYDSNGEPISPHIIHDICSFGGVKQFQLVQLDAKKYLFKINATDEFDKNQLLKRYKELLGENSELIVEYVDEIPLLESGKRKQVVNLMEGDNCEKI
ncbi:MAG: CoF synthetase [Flavobacteriaceae bacterium]|nr:CoF synthetase [Flavobacteriaceae bacterium]